MYLFIRKYSFNTQIHTHLVMLTFAILLNSNDAIYDRREPVIVCNKNCFWLDTCNIQISNTPVHSKTLAMTYLQSTEKNTVLMTSCPSNWMDDDIRSLCLKHVNEDDYSYILDVPYVSQTTNVMYANLYCAMCNDDYKNSASVKLAFHCYEIQLCGIEVLQTGTYNKNQLSWTLPNNQVFKAEILEQYDLKDYSASTEKYNFRNCASQNSFLKAKQNSSSCSFVPIYHLEELKAGTPPVSHDGTSLALIIDFSLANEKCSEFEIYDGISKKCINLLCSVTKIPYDRNCKQQYDNTTEMQYKNDTNFQIYENKTGNNSIRYCASKKIPIKEFTIFDNGTIFHKRTLIIYTDSDYTWFDNETYLVCDDLKHLMLPLSVRVFSSIQTTLSTVCISISLICLILHTIIQITVMRCLSSIPGKYLLSLSTSLLIAQITFLIGVNRTENKNMCFAIAVIIHFFYLSVFFWMNVMSYDIFRSVIRNSLHGSRSYIKASIYAWLFPTFIVVTAIILDLTNALPHVRPYYGWKVCWISNRFANFIFLVMPLAVLLLENILFLLLTAFHIQKTLKLTSKLHKSSNFNRYQVYVKLIFINGMTWIFGFIASLTEIELLWYIFLIFNASQGIFVFLIFTLKSKVIKILCNKVIGKHENGGGTTKPTVRTCIPVENTPI